MLNIKYKLLKTALRAHNTFYLNILVEIKGGILLRITSITNYNV